MRKIQRKRGVLEASFDNAKVIYDIDTHTPHILNGTAAAIWAYIKSPKTKYEIAQYIAKRYDIDVETVKRDVTHFIKELRKKELIIAQTSTSAQAIPRGIASPRRWRGSQ